MILSPQGGRYRGGINGDGRMLRQRTGREVEVAVKTKVPYKGVNNPRDLIVAPTRIKFYRSSQVSFVGDALRRSRQDMLAFRKALDR